MTPDERFSKVRNYEVSIREPDILHCFGNISTKTQTHTHTHTHTGIFGSIPHLTSHESGDFLDL